MIVVLEYNSTKGHPPIVEEPGRVSRRSWGICGRSGACWQYSSGSLFTPVKKKACFFALKMVTCWVWGCSCAVSRHKKTQTRKETMTTINLDHIHSRIEQLQAEIAESPYTMEEALESAAAVKAALAGMHEGDVDVDALRAALDGAGEAHHLASLADDLRRLRQTLETTLVRVEKRFVIIGADEKLLSPAGFMPSERVFVKTRIMEEAKSLGGVREISLGLPGEAVKCYDLAKESTALRLIAKEVQS